MVHNGTDRSASTFSKRKMARPGVPEKVVGVDSASILGAAQQREADLKALRDKLRQETRDN